MAAVVRMTAVGSQDPACALCATALRVLGLRGAEGFGCATQGWVRLAAGPASEARLHNCAQARGSGSAVARSAQPCAHTPPAGSSYDSSLQRCSATSMVNKSASGPATHAQQPSAAQDGHAAGLNSVTARTSVQETVELGASKDVRWEPQQDSECHCPLLLFVSKDLHEISRSGCQGSVDARDDVTNAQQMGECGCAR